MEKIHSEKEKDLLKSHLTEINNLKSNNDNNLQNYKVQVENLKIEYDNELKSKIQEFEENFRRKSEIEISNLKMKLENFKQLCELKDKEFHEGKIKNNEKIDEIEKNNLLHLSKAIENEKRNSNLKLNEIKFLLQQSQESKDLDNQKNFDNILKTELHQFIFYISKII